ncbi:MAG: type II toxin-antitoxin system VapC family toxin [Terricaulis sp.]
MKSAFLLDTCAALWIVDGILSKDVGEALLASHKAGLPTYISPITAWEVGNMARKGRFKSNLAPDRWFNHLMKAPRAALAGMSPDLLMASCFLPAFPNNDPADRIIAATAREYGFTVVTRDAALLSYGKQGYLSVLAC